ncbi:Uma2 family endonuclease [Streptomyces iconiensis]|uniref:Uma2 family endonuclease n=1 Tax=Streptomyces iconiensis TaxID=1384038 RepID=A0ABT6ZMY4_9ACTN|nr:Uma2 family endonuclease [Streptomyces iconiensis]MDJ1130416.1 Uma2 family endonuclease [Streptomyces iconiensis]
MTVVAERMDVPMTDSRAIDAFEGFEAPEGFRVELLQGEIVMMAGPDLVHNRIVTRAMDQIPADRWERVQTQDVAILAENSEPVPDLVVMSLEDAPVSGRLLPSETIKLAVEVVSKTSVHRDYVTKRMLYAAGGVSGYLIIDPFKGECVLLTEPSGKGEQADYRVERRTRFGETVPLDLLGMKLDTAQFQTYPVNQPEP